jgi:predicted metalloprotease with PDZ domain
MAGIAYRVELFNPKAHLFRVTLSIANPTGLQRVALPVWIPGSYLVREFSKNLQHLKARQGQARLAVEQLDKCSWQIELELMSPKGLPGWCVATGLNPKKILGTGFGTYLAGNYDELADAPVEMGTFWSGTFLAGNVPHRFVVADAPASFDGERLLADAQKICETQIRFWHERPAGGRGKKKAPFSSYVFMLKATDDGYGGLEHRNSTALICGRKDLPRLPATRLSPAEFKPGEGYVTLLGLISHEYFHSWNVKRLRPIEFKRYDYGSENYTQLLWFFEGFTSYFDDLLLYRAGLIDEAAYLKLIGKTINQVLQTPGRSVQSVAQASFDAWVKYYRTDENTPNATVSYYTKGALIALCLDLTLRLEGTSSLDEVMRGLWHRCDAGPMNEDDLQAVLKALGGRSFGSELARWVHGTGELPLRELLQSHGVAVLEEPSQLAQQLGLRVTEGAGLKIKTVFRGGLAEHAGFAADDDWLGIEVGKGKNQRSWRLQRLDDLLLYASNSTEIRALVERDKALLWLPLKLPRTSATWRLALKDPGRVKHWLGEKAQA